jgi:hypothetical protein
VAPSSWEDTTLLGWTGNFHRKVAGLYDLYRQPNQGQATFEQGLRKQLAEYRKEQHIAVYGDGDGSAKVVVEVIGVFDTVPAIGWGLDEDPDGHRIELYARRGYHAMSLDEQRDAFRLQRFAVPQVRTQALEEVWFAGVHADVGGGYNKKEDSGMCKPSLDGKQSEPIGLSAAPLRWMLARTQADGIFAAQWPSLCVDGRLHDEYFDASWLKEVVYRNAGLLRRKPVECDRVDYTVIERMQVKQLPSRHPYREPDGVYRPSNLGHAPLATFSIVQGDSQTSASERCEARSQGRRTP